LNRGGSPSLHLEPPSAWKSSPGSRNSGKRPRSASSGSGRRRSVRSPSRAWTPTSPASCPGPSRRSSGEPRGLFAKARVNLPEVRAVPRTGRPRSPCAEEPAVV